MSFFRYPGGKSKLRDDISECLSKQAIYDGLHYREPFFGGGSVGLKFFNDNPTIKNIWINDKDIGIACLWTSVIRYIGEFKKLIYDFKPSVKAFYEIKKELSSLAIMPKQKNKIIEIGFKKLVIHQISYSGLGTKSGGPLGGEKQESNYKIDCRWSPEHICKKATNLNIKFSEMSIKDDGCTNLDFSDLITQKSSNCLIYLDPPYFVKGNNLYQHGFNMEDHKRLADLLKKTKHMWVLSYDDCPEIRKLYGDWSYLQSLNVKYSITAKTDETGKKLLRTKPELLIYPRE